jgi:excisionase family DNA binding protein
MRLKQSTHVSDVPVGPPSTLDPQQILTIDELASRLKTSRRWVYEKSRRRCQNPLPAIHIGRYLRFNWVDVSAWLRSQTTGRAG